MVTVQSHGETARDPTVRDADHPRDSQIAHFGADKPLKLDAGVELAPFQIAYKTYGTLNTLRSNAVLVCHALTGDQHVASAHPVTKKQGWWETMVERDWRLHGLDRSVLDRPGERKTLGP